MAWRSSEEPSDDPVIQVVRVGLRWRGSSVALPNPRYGWTAGAARRRIQSDLDYEWRTGKPHPRQRVRR